MRVLDLFCGEGGAGEGYRLAGFEVTGVDNDPDRLRNNPHSHLLADAIDVLDGDLDFDLIHASPPCQGYSVATTGLPSRWSRYDRLIALVRAKIEATGKPYVIENVEGARRELRDPILLCGRMFDLTATDVDGTPLTMDRHRLFESNLPITAPPHPHQTRMDRRFNVAGAYGGGSARRQRARYVRRGGYTPTLAVRNAMMGTEWMSQIGGKLAIPPVYTRYLGRQIKEML